MTDLKSEHFIAIRENELSAIEQSAQSAQYWTLAQAAAWVMFRDISVVARFTPPRADRWEAYLMYTQDWKKPPVEQQWHDLFRKLGAGQIDATGRRASDGVREPIPSMHWMDLAPDVDTGPYISDETGKRARPWADFLVLRADVERLWRRPSEVEGRSKYPKGWFRDQYLQLKEAQPASSKNELIGELQAQFQEETKREPPSRSSIQDYLKGL